MPAAARLPRPFRRPVRSLVAAHPDNPDVVYGAFGVDGIRSGLYRSGDGGPDRGAAYDRSKKFRQLFVHPASPSTIYIGGE